MLHHLAIAMALVGLSVVTTLSQRLILENLNLRYLARLVGRFSVLPRNSFLGDAQMLIDVSLART